jgi:hypothetical protein
LTLYGDIPYSEANLRGGNATPKYDNSQEIYTEKEAKLTRYNTDKCYS